jgi:hypothetical protein
VVLVSDEEGDADKTGSNGACSRRDGRHAVHTQDVAVTANPAF